MADTAAPMSATSAFAQVNAALIDRGLLRSPLDVSGMADVSVRALSDVLHGLIAQRVQDSDLREQLAARNRVLDASLERTKRFWKEDEEKRADCERKLEAIKAQIGLATEQKNAAELSLRKSREELQKTRKDLLTVKQQAAQQRQANDRQQERLRSRYTEEAIKALRLQSPQVMFSASSSVGSAGLGSKQADVSASDVITRRHIDELERRREQMMDYNAALKRMATECLNLAKTAGEQLTELVGESAEESAETEKLASSTHAGGSSSAATPVVLFQRDLFPPLNVLQADYSILAVRDVVQHPAVDALSKISDKIERQVRALRQGRSLRTWNRIRDARQRMRDSISAAQDNDARADGRVGQEDNGDDDQAALDKLDDEQERQRLYAELEELQQALARLRQQVRQAEAEVQAADEGAETLKIHIKRNGEPATDDAKGSNEGELLALQQQMAEVERQRQRYLALCRALEEQEAAVAEERDRLIREREQVTLEHSLSMVSTSSVGGETTQSTAMLEHVSVDGGGDADDSRESTFTSFVRPVGTADASTSMQHRYASTPQQPLRSVKRAHDATASEKENERPKGAALATSSGIAPKRIRTDGATAAAAKDATLTGGTRVIAGSEMRFITMRKQRGAGSSGGTGR